MRWRIRKEYGVRSHERGTRSTALRCDLSLHTLRPRGSERPQFPIRLHWTRLGDPHARTKTRMGDEGRGDIASVTPATPEDAARAELYKEEANEYFKST